MAEADEPSGRMEEADGLLGTTPTRPPPRWRQRVAALGVAALAVLGISYLELADPSLSPAAARWRSPGGLRARSRAAVEYFGVCMDCCGKSCEACTSDYKCNWCPETQDCHAVGSVKDKCDVPIDTVGQCWGQTCPYQIGAFLNDRADDTKQWGLQSSKASRMPLQTFPTYPQGCGEPSATCTKNINWAMNTGIRENPQWYPGLSSDSPADAFQEHLAGTPGTGCVSPCSADAAPRVGIFDLQTGAPTTYSAGSPVDGYVVAVVGDWGSGTCVAKTVASMMAATDPQLTIHLGDVYFVATEEQYDTNIAGKARWSWQGEGVRFPKGSVSTFLMTGNHELISGCAGLFNSGFYYSGQTTTYGVWQSDSWRLVALDTGYLSYESIGNSRNLMSETNAPMPSQIVDWLVNVVKLGNPDDKRGIVLFTHHQPVSAWNTAYTGAAMQLQHVLPNGITVVWLFGHMHALALYGKSQLEGTDFSFYPRLIGNGGFPNEMPKVKNTHNLIAVDQRVYQSIPAVKGSQKIGFNGYTKMTINGAQLSLDYITANCRNGNCQEGLSAQSTTTVASETFSVDLASGSLTQEWTQIGSELTKFQEPDQSTRSVSCAAPPPYGKSGALVNNGMD